MVSLVIIHTPSDAAVAERLAEHFPQPLIFDVAAIGDSVALGPNLPAVAVWSGFDRNDRSQALLSDFVIASRGATVLFCVDGVAPPSQLSGVPIMRVMGCGRWDEDVAAVEGVLDVLASRRDGDRAQKEAVQVDSHGQSAFRRAGFMTGIAATVAMFGAASNGVERATSALMSGLEGADAQDAIVAAVTPSVRQYEPAYKVRYAAASPTEAAAKLAGDVEASLAQRQAFVEEAVRRVDGIAQRPHLNAEEVLPPLPLEAAPVMAEAPAATEIAMSAEVAGHFDTVEPLRVAVLVTPDSAS
jgi:hypothetical protein